VSDACKGTPGKVAQRCVAAWPEDAIRLVPLR
jgi:hypothetical protein